MGMGGATWRRWLRGHGTHIRRPQNFGICWPPRDPPSLSAKSIQSCGKTFLLSWENHPQNVRNVFKLICTVCPQTLCIFCADVTYGSPLTPNAKNANARVLAIEGNQTRMSGLISYKGKRTCLESPKKGFPGFQNGLLRCSTALCFSCTAEQFRRTFWEPRTVLLVDSVQHDPSPQLLGFATSVPGMLVGR